SREAPENQATGENLAYVIYTSGSTGQPKGVGMPQKALFNLLAWQVKNLECSRQKRTLQFASISFDVAFQEIFSALGNGGTLVLVSEEERMEVSRLVRVIKRFEIERLFFPVVFLNKFADYCNNDVREIKMVKEIIVAGEQLKMLPGLQKLMRNVPELKIYNHYGPSETHVVTSYEINNGNYQNYDLPPIGKPIDNVKLYILDKNMKMVPVGISGELYIGGICLSKGYYKRESFTKERFITNPFISTSFNDSFLYRTGDSVRYLANGEIEYIGRIDNQVKIRGYRIELGEVEAVLS
ncbi:non-ribosomal peptide synthetase, partial [Paenibacillus odorifer]|uniref:AMP-binding protein n=2 Tax=Paenibacillus odorifer TaxID=189426 RepID=UPI00097A6430